MRKIMGLRAFWNVLQFVFSDEFMELQTLLLNDYTRYSLNDVISEVKKLLKEQENLERNAKASLQEIKEARTDIDSVYKLCRILESDKDTSEKRINYSLTKEDIQQIVSTELNNGSRKPSRELNALAVSYQTMDEKLSNIYQLLVRNNLLWEQFQVQPLKSSAETEAFQEQIKNLEKEKEFYKAQLQIFHKENEQLKAYIQEMEKETAVSQIFNPYIITNNREKYLINAENRNDMLAKLGNTIILEKFFENIPASTSYKKMYERYKKNLKKCLEKSDEDDEIEEILSSVVNIVQGDLLKKIMVAIYRGKKSENSDLESRLLKAVNSYLESIGFYTREDICVGNIIKDKDFEDMEFIKDEQTAGRRHGEITEIELYPYYINYIDEDGEKRNMHTQGMMIVLA